METIYSNSGNIYSPMSKAGLTDKLPAACFTIGKNQMTGAFYLNKIDNYVLPTRRFGNNDKMAKRILNTFFERKVQTGVLLSGEKGSGKSLLAKTLAVVGQEDYEYPTIVINEPWHGEAFNQFIQSIEQPAVVIFDEFEKTYSKDRQEAVLTLLDGMYPANKLYVFTVNDKYRIDTHMRNRPGRIYYALEYAGLTQEFIREYCEAFLEDKVQIDSVLRASLLFREFNFDMLRAVVEEMNRYKETAQEVLAILNAKPEFDEGGKFKVKLSLANGTRKVKTLYNEFWSGNPLISENIRIEYGYEEPAAGGKEATEEYDSTMFSANDLRTVDTKEGTFVFENANGDSLKLSRKAATRINYTRFVS